MTSWQWVKTVCRQNTNICVKFALCEIFYDAPPNFFSVVRFSFVRQKLCFGYTPFSPNGYHATMPGVAVVEDLGPCERIRVFLNKHYLSTGNQLSISQFDELTELWSFQHYHFSNMTDQGIISGQIVVVDLGPWERVIKMTSSTTHTQK